jgi:rod shape determining protein RodA
MERSRNNIFVRIDWLTVLMYLALVVFGLINIYSSAYNEDHPRLLDFSMRYGKQFYWILLAVAIAIIIFALHPRFYYFFAWPIYLLSLFLLLAVLVIGATVHGSTSWISVGGIHLQPSEFAKVATALALARYLSEYNVSLEHFRDLVKASLIIILPAGLIMLQPDMGSTFVFTAFILVLYREGLRAEVLILGFLFIVLFILTLIVDRTIVLGILLALTLVMHLLLERRPPLTGKGTLAIAVLGLLIWGGSHLLHRSLSLYTVIFLSILGGAVIFLPFIYRLKLVRTAVLYAVLILAMLFTFSVNYVFNNILEPHQRTRINIVLGIESDPYGSGYNVNQSKIAIGSGGFSGKGFLNGTQTKFNFVPEQSTDFIFCTVGEEWGFLGTFGVIVFYLLFLMRILYLAERQRSVFNRIYGYSVFSLLSFHVLVNIGMTIGLFPVIGIPLPFFSYGGSSLWAFTILLFIFIRLDADRLEMTF